MDARDIIAEADRRASIRSSMLGSTFPVQRAAISDPSRLKAFFCPRRSGKSYAIGVLLFMASMASPHSSCLYLGLTKASATGILNKDIIRPINERFRLGAVWRESHMRWELPNGSHIYIRGADANAYEIDKTVGQKYRLAVLDEASKYRYVVRDMVYGKLLPAMGDDLGTIVLAGTPSNITAGLFYDVTTRAEGGWSVHHWTWKQNIHRVANIQRAHDDLVDANPAIVETPLYKQEWLGEWCVDSSALVYRYREDRNTAAALPKPWHEYIYILGVDLGFSDATSFVLTCYHPNDPTLYIVSAEKHGGLTFSDVATRIRAIMAAPVPGVRGPVLSAIVVDAANLQGVEELRQRHELPLEAADKPGKRGVIEAMNSDLITGLVKLLPGAMGLADEWRSLIWNQTLLAKMPPRWEEDARFANHAADGALYAWRRARNYDVAAPAETKPDRDSQAWADADLERRLRERSEIARGGWPGGLVRDQLPEWKGR